MGQYAPPTVKNHDHVDSRRNLAVQVVGNGTAQYIQQQVHQVGLPVQHAFGQTEILARCAFNHVGGNGPGTAGEAYQRHFAVQFLFDQPDGIQHVTQVGFNIRHRQVADVVGRA